jgi:hypothetical protein
LLQLRNVEVLGEVWGSVIPVVEEGAAMPI